MITKRVYLKVRSECVACDEVILSLGIRKDMTDVNSMMTLKDGTNLHVTYDLENNIKSTPCFDFVTVEDKNGNGIEEEIEETFIKRYNGFLSKRGIEDILEQIERGNVLETNF